MGTNLKKFIAALFLFASTYAAASTFDLPLTGRLTEKNGKPIEGPVELSISFFHVQKDGVPVATVTDGLANVSLQEGIFQVTLNLSASDWQRIFPDTAQPVYVEVTDATHAPDAPYARFQVAMAPLAGKVPVDGKTIAFDDDGRARLVTAGASAVGKLLSADGAGGLVWVDPPTNTVTQVSGVSAANVALGANAANGASSAKSGGTIVKRDDNGGFDVGAVSADSVTLTAATSMSKPLTVKAAAAQTADLQQWLSSTGSLLAGIGADGSLKLGSANNTVSLKAPAGMSGSVSYVLPAAPANGSFLTTDANGILSWVSLGGGGDMARAVFDANNDSIVDASADGQKFVTGSGWAGAAPAVLTTLGADLAAGATTATVASTAGYPSAGLLVIGNEVIRYTGLTGTTFTGLTRGVFGTTDALQTNGATVNNLLFSAATSASTPKVVVTGEGRTGIGTFKPGAMLETTSTTDIVTQIVRGSASQTAALQQWQANNGTVLSYVNKDGGLALKGSDTANYVTLKGGAGMAGNLSLTLPPAQGASGSFLTNNGSGILSWSTATAPASGTIATLAGAEALTNKTFDATTTITGATAASLTNGSATITLPTATGTLATLAGTETLTNKTISGGTLAANAGTVAAPSVSFSGDTDTGIWSSGANTINLSTAGSERLRVDASGNVGIGTTSPTFKLSTLGTVNVAGAGGEDYGGTLRVGNGSAGAFTIVGSDATGNVSIDNANTVGGDIDIKRRGSSALFVKGSNGDVGIGTTSPGAKLDVAATSGDLFRATGTAHRFYLLEASTGVYDLGNSSSGTHIRLSNANHTSLFQPVVTIGATTFVNDTHLAVLGSNAAYTTAIVRGAASQTANLQQWQDSTGNGLVTVSATGAVGIGTTAPVGTLDVRGPIENGLVGWWMFDEGSGTSAADASVSAVSATIAGTPAWGLGRFGSALQLDGVDDYAAAAGIPARATQTMSAWINLSSSAANFPMAVTDSGGFDLRLLTTTMLPEFVVGVSQATSATALAINTWYHIAGVYDGSSVKVFVNGVLKASTAASGATPGTTVNIGRRSDGYYFPGMIDDARVYSRALSAREIADIYQTGANNNSLSGGFNVTSGNVGVGTASAASQLHVTASSAATTGLIVQGAASQTANLAEMRNSAGTAVFSFDPTGTKIGTAASGILAIGGGFLQAGAQSTGIGNNIYAGITAVSIGYNTSASTDGVAIGHSANAAFQRSIALGRLATTTAVNQFVVGSATAPAAETYLGSGVTDANPVSATIHATGGSGTDIAGAALQLAGGQGTGAGAGGPILFHTAPAGSSGTSLNASAERMRITTGGNVGIGTTVPAGKLEIASETGTQEMLRVRNYAESATGAFGSTYGSEFRHAASGSYLHNMLIHLAENNAARHVLDITASGGTVASFRSDGSVGIGTTAASGRLETLSSNNTPAGIFGAESSGSQTADVVKIYSTDGDTSLNLLNVIGSASYSSGWSGGTSRFVVRGDGNVGIGTTSPGSILEVNQSGTTSTQGMTRFLQPGLSTGNYMSFDFGKAESSNQAGMFSFSYDSSGSSYVGLGLWGDSVISGTGLIVKKGGNVGIGTTNPTYALHSPGAAYLNGILFSGNGGVVNYNDAPFNITNNANNVLTLGTNNSERFRIDAVGNVGIGTTSPASKLEIAGNIRTTGSFLFGADDQTQIYRASDASLFFLAASTRAEFRPGIGWQLDSSGKYGWVSGNVTNSAMDTGFARNAAGVVEINNGTTGQYRDLQVRAINPGSGNVGIGTTAPGALLDVAGNIQLANGAYFQSSAGAGSQSIQLNDSAGAMLLRSLVGPLGIRTVNGGANNFVIDNSGNVGIGVTTPATPLDVRHTTSGSGSSLRLQNNSVSGYTELALYSSASASVAGLGYGNASAVYSPGGAYFYTAGKDFSFSLDSGGSTALFLKSSNGYVGIGTTSPTSGYKLDTIGSGRFEGSLCVKNATGACAGTTAGTIYANATTISAADLAEHMPVDDESLMPGDVVAIGRSATSGEAVFSKTETSHQANAFGVVSTRPGVALGGEAKSSRPIALAGRVPVNVTLEGGPISIGDYLVASGTAGKAMRAKDPSQGGILGIALSAYEGDAIPARDHEDGIAHEHGHQVMMLVQAGASQAGLSVLKAKAERIEAKAEKLEAENAEIKAENARAKAENAEIKAALCQIQPQLKFCE